MHYDPIKNVFAAVIKAVPFTRVLFYKTLDLMFLRSWYVRREIKNLRKELGSKKIDIYDAGCGYGQYTYFMSQKLAPCTIYASDIKEDWINDCREYFTSQKINNVSFHVEDLRNISHENRFDLIVCVDVMEHIHEDVEVLGNYHRALKPGGFLVINTPSIYGGSDVHDDHEESFIGEHARDGYSFEDLRDKCEPLGLKVYSSRYTYGFWGDKAWRLGIKYPMMMLNLSKIFFLILPFYYLLTLPFTLIMMQMDFGSENSVGSGINFIAQKK
ncbi:MAG: methyltransferase domain-containing protein [Ignavibacteriaceae bacterium]|nr:methyltransferase domain-containing protein [Ignavibacteriaceae bacterium]